jgi:hypothetical protein
MAPSQDRRSGVLVGGAKGECHVVDIYRGVVRAVARGDWRFMRMKVGDFI